MAEVGKLDCSKIRELLQRLEVLKEAGRRRRYREEERQRQLHALEDKKAREEQDARGFSNAAAGNESFSTTNTNAVFTAVIFVRAQRSHRHGTIEEFQ